MLQIQNGLSRRFSVPPLLDPTLAQNETKMTNIKRTVPRRAEPHSFGVLTPDLPPTV